MRRVEFGVQDYWLYVPDYFSVHTSQSTIPNKTMASNLAPMLEFTVDMVFN